MKNFQLKGVFRKKLHTRNYRRWLIDKKSGFSMEIVVQNSGYSVAHLGILQSWDF